MRHDPTRIELQAQFDDLSERISTTERTLALTADHQQQLSLATMRDDLYAERAALVNRIIALPLRRTASAANETDVEYDELTRMLYEIRSDVAILKRQFDDHLRNCAPEGAGFPPNFLTFLAIGGVVTLLLLAFIVVRIGMPG